MEWNFKLVLTRARYPLWNTSLEASFAHIFTVFLFLILIFDIDRCVYERCFLLKHSYSMLDWYMLPVTATRLKVVTNLLGVSITCARFLSIRTWDVFYVLSIHGYSIVLIRTSFW